MIKFRAWEKEEKVMCCVLEMKFDSEELIKVGIGYPDGLNSSLRFPSMIELMRCTGLKDKNGKYIYEGDVFNCHYSDETKNHHKWQVVWNNESAGFVLSRIGEPCNQKMVHQRVSDYSGWRGEIIGNIYENKELLK